MKAIFIFLFLIIASAVAGQQDESIELGEFTVTPPKFIGIENATALLEEQKTETINEFLAKNVEYPEDSKTHLREGVVVVQFMVTEAGDISNLQVINSISDDLDNEVKRVLKRTDGMWLPGNNNGQPHAMKKEASVCFKLDFSSNPNNSISRDFKEVAKNYFTKGSKRLFEKDRPKAALRAFNNAMAYLPMDHALLLNRSYCKYALGDIEGAQKDWTRIKELGGNDASIASILEDQMEDFEIDPLFYQLVVK